MGNRYFRLLKENATTDVEGLEPTDPEAEDWELGFEEAVVGVDAPGGVPEGTGLYGAAKRSFLVSPNIEIFMKVLREIYRIFQDEFDKNVNSNLKLLFVGCTVLLLYVTYNLGRPNLLEQRVSFPANYLFLTKCTFGFASDSALPARHGRHWDVGGLILRVLLLRRVILRR